MIPKAKTAVIANIITITRIHPMITAPITNAATQIVDRLKMMAKIAIQSSTAVAYLDPTT